MYTFKKHTVTVHVSDYLKTSAKKENMLRDFHFLQKISQKIIDFDRCVTYVMYMYSQNWQRICKVTNMNYHLIKPRTVLQNAFFVNKQCAKCSACLCTSLLLNLISDKLAGNNTRHFRFLHVLSCHSVCLLTCTCSLI